MFSDSCLACTEVVAWPGPQLGHTVLFRLCASVLCDNGLVTRNQGWSQGDENFVIALEKMPTEKA